MAFLTSNIISMIGNEFAIIALPWFVLQTTGSAAKTGLVAFSTTAPLVIAGIFGGSLVDRFGYKRMSIVADIMSGITMASIPLLYLTTGLAFWQLILLVFLGALLDTPGNAARTSLTPELARLARFSLDRVNAAVQAITYLSSLLGPPIAGLLIAILSPTDVLWLNAFSFAVSATLFVRFIPADHSKRLLTRFSVSHHLQDVREGLSYIFSNSLLRSIIIFVSVANFLTLPLFGVVLPVYAQRVFGSAVDFGLVLASFGGGSLLGVSLYGWIGNRIPRRTVLIGGFLSAALPLSILTLQPESVLLTSAALALFGLVRGPTNPLLITIIQERIPENVRGRTFSTMRAISYIASPIGMAVAGLLLEFTTLRLTLSLLTVAYFFVTLSLFINPALKNLNNGRSESKLKA